MLMVGTECSDRVKVLMEAQRKWANEARALRKNLTDVTRDAMGLEEELEKAQTAYKQTRQVIALCFLAHSTLHLYRWLIYPPPCVLIPVPPPALPLPPRLPPSSLSARPTPTNDSLFLHHAALDMFHMRLWIRRLCCHVLLLPACCPPAAHLLTAWPADARLLTAELESALSRQQQHKAQEQSAQQQGQQKQEAAHVKAASEGQTGAGGEGGSIRGGKLQDGGVVQAGGAGRAGRMRGGGDAKDAVAAVVIMACNRVDYLDRTIQSVLLHHKGADSKFPLFISQVEPVLLCSTDEVQPQALKCSSFISVPFTPLPLLLSACPTQHIETAPPRMNNPGENIAYYRIAEHYKFALTELFDRRQFPRVIILEDDMELAPDFFDFFEAASNLLDVDDPSGRAPTGTTGCVDTDHNSRTSYFPLPPSQIHLGSLLVERQAVCARRAPALLLGLLPGPGLDAEERAVGGDQAQVGQCLLGRLAVLTPTTTHVPPCSPSLPLRSILAVSSWNDNGQKQFVHDSHQLYRSDFFPGLGWMLRRELWAELKPKWARAYWDDWLRLPEQRKGRQTIRPEVCRTYNFGEHGSSMGQYFSQYLAPIRLNTEPINWAQKDLSYLLDVSYPSYMLSQLRSARLIPLAAVNTEVVTPSELGYDVMVEYRDESSFAELAGEFGVFQEWKAGVPRTAYSGVVVFRYHGPHRVFFVERRGLVSLTPSAAKSIGFRASETAPSHPVVMASSRLCHVSASLSHRTLLPVPSHPTVDFTLAARPAVPQRRRALRLSAPRAQADDSATRRSGPRWDPLLADSGTDCPVPEEQQPINEYQSLLESAVFPWVTLDGLNYALRLVGVGVVVSALIGWPVASLTFDPKRDALQCLLGSLGGGQLAVTLAALRLYLGWSYIGNRLFSATVEYEETGWYDGQVWVKTPELLARDRLLASYKVKPVLNRLKSTLLGLGLSLAATTALLFLLPSSSSSSSLSSFTPASYISDSPATSALTAQQEQRAGEVVGGDYMEDEVVQASPLLNDIPGCGPAGSAAEYKVTTNQAPLSFANHPFSPHSPPSFICPLSCRSVCPKKLLPSPSSVGNEPLFSSSEATAFAKSLAIFSSKADVEVTGQQQQQKERLKCLSTSSKQQQQQQQQQQKKKKKQIQGDSQWFFAECVALTWRS
ncbi:unnamed protein product, partial [Closterium sp. NIES-54]